MPYEPLSTAIPQIAEQFNDLMKQVRENMEDSQHFDPMAKRKVVIEVELVPLRPDHSELEIFVGGSVKLPKKLAKKAKAKSASGQIHAWLDEEFQEEIPNTSNVRLFADGGKRD